ncbi:MAG: glycogen debranching protein [Betaproteobacteria bacterium]|nr:glycogen debranching protein [Betaproteobacteria bacterium]
MTNAPAIVGWRRGDPVEQLLEREWLVTNGLGGYASATLGGCCTRRYHGALIAALPAPLGRTVCVPFIDESVIAGRGKTRLSAIETAAETCLPDGDWIAEISLECGLPVWRYSNGSCAIEKKIAMPYLRNATCIQYRLVAPSDTPVELELRPYIGIRAHEASVDAASAEYQTEVLRSGWKIALDGYPDLILCVTPGRGSFMLDRHTLDDVVYRVERGRGYPHMGKLTSPGRVRVSLNHGQSITLLISADGSVDASEAANIIPAEVQRRRSLLLKAAPEFRRGPAAQLVLAADQFIVAPHTRTSDRADARTVIAGYPWFTDWGRDTMISLEGLCLLTGRLKEAGAILRTFASHTRDGLIPNLFPEGENSGLYHTADATLWFFHAIHRYLAATNDRAMLQALLPILKEIIDHHLEGTKFGIRVDPVDGLLAQGEPGYQLTWMDAKVDNWVVTPRRGKAVEINALFYNALMLFVSWVRGTDAEAAAIYEKHAERARRSFNALFWNEGLGCLYDVIDAENGGNDPALRPNQLLAISLDHPVLDERRWRPVLDAVERELLTPVGLRTLARSHPDYKPQYDGDLRARDAAYHQGTVWPWLIGPFMDAWLKVHHDSPANGNELVASLYAHMSDGCMGSVAEIFDAEKPFRSRGCIAQAWSVAELLRVTALLREPPAAVPNAVPHHARAG